MKNCTQRAEYWIERLELVPHPEGGFYRETYRSRQSYDFGTGTSFGGTRNHATAIYYLLRAGDRSRLHSIRSDELWFYHAGSPLCVHCFPPDGEQYAFVLGLDADNGEVLQAMVPSESWFGAMLDQQAAAAESYSLVSCVVAPGFDFRDFSFAPRSLLLERYPAFSSVIDRLS